MIRNSIKIAILIIIFTNADIFSQPNELTLDDCLNIAMKNSPQILIAKQNFQSQKLQYQAFKSSYLPQLSLTGSIPGLSREIIPYTQPDGSEIFLAKSNLYSTSGLEISQKIPLTGATININSGISRIDILGDETTSRWLSNPIQISIVQPIFQTNYMSWDKRIQELMFELNKKRFIENIENIKSDITSAFFNLYIAQMNIKNAEIILAVNDTLFQMSKGRFKVGTIAENDLLKSELEFANAQITFENAKIDLMKAFENLEIKLGIELDSNIIIKPPKDTPFIEIDPDEAIKIALKNSSTLINYSINYIQSERDLQTAESQNSFNANLIASYGLSKSTTQSQDLFNQLLDQERFNLTFSIPLFQFGKGSSEIESALIKKQNSLEEMNYQKKNFELNLKYQILYFNQLQKQVKIAARNDTIASKRFQVAKNRFIVGKIDMNDLFLAQNETIIASKNYYQTLSNYWDAYYSIRKLTLYDFIKRKNLEIEF